MSNQSELKGMPTTDMRNAVLEIFELNEAIAEKKKIRDKVLDDVMIEIKKSGKRSIVTENMDGDAIVVRLISTSEKIIFSKPPKKKVKSSTK